MSQPALTDAAVKQTLSSVIDPVFEHDIVSYRLFKSAAVQGRDVTVRVEIPTHAYPEAARRELAQRIEGALVQAGAGAVTVIPEVVTAFVPAPSDKAILKGPKNIIAVAAGKGGVGKSTVATNHA